MKKNIGSLDRWIRIVLGLIIAILGYMYKSWWGLLALIPLVTAFINFCGIYAIFGISTCNKKE